MNNSPSQHAGLKKVAPATYHIPKRDGMRVPGLIIASEGLLKEQSIEEPLQQVRNVACLPGIVKHSIAMPDIHWGYGFAIGGVAAMHAKSGVISPGGVGYDINCGVRLALVPLPFKSFTPSTRKELIDQIHALIPSGVGRGKTKDKVLSESDYRSLIQHGARWSVENGYGCTEDLSHTESYGCIEGANIDAISSLAKQRGTNQLGTIGSGNHFVEIGEIQKIFIEDIATAWGVEEGMTYILIHSGSRGFGHQICQDSLNSFIKKGYHKGLPDRQLVCAPIQSSEGQLYLSRMAAASNFAFSNRQYILHKARKAFQKVCSIPIHRIKLLYDVCHNIAKFEIHEGRRVCVHRKGATRAYGPNAEGLIPLFKKTGQPVLVPGDMGRASYLMVGLGNHLTFCSSCHGAGRAHSRIQSLKLWKGQNLTEHMERQNVLVRASSSRTIAEEMPDAYKDVDEVTEAVEEAKLANRIARLSPRMVLKG